MSNSITMVPVLPESAPFTAEQRSWLNGYLAGLFSWTPTGQAVVAPAAALKPATILFASQTGGAEKAAKQLAKKAKTAGFEAAVTNLSSVKPADLAGKERLWVIASTYGDGEPPDSAMDFWKAFSTEQVDLKGAQFSVLALGDSNYVKFCEFGKQLDARFEALGATRVAARQDCDGDWAPQFQTWSSEVLGAGAMEPAEDEVDSHREARSPLVVNEKLSGEGSAKDVRHFEFSLAGTGLQYACGDALSVWPENDPALVEAILAAGSYSGDELVVYKKQSITLHEALWKHCDIARAPKAPGIDLLDYLKEHSPALEAQALVDLLKDLKPRLYSISSSPAAHGENVHLTISTVRWESQGRLRNGVCSTFLADRLSDGTARVSVHENTAFRPPAGDVPLIMIGPGTGIAPFRGFLHERKAVGATGKNWLLFGDQHAATDYLYANEIQAFVADGTLHELDLAWSRDGADKVYVQHLLLAKAEQLYSWLEAGAAIYICGDASRMAKDVDKALHQAIQQASKGTAEEAEAYVRKLKAERRYQRDVY
jgi:sulfite reductase (NADPH) flavoprotein alpha-component